MRKTALIMLVLFASAIAVAAGEVEFVDTYAMSKQIAGEQNKNMLITFYTDW